MQTCNASKCWQYIHSGGWEWFLKDTISLWPHTNALCGNRMNGEQYLLPVLEKLKILYSLVTALAVWEDSVQEQAPVKYWGWLCSRSGNPCLGNHGTSHCSFFSSVLLWALLVLVREVTLPSSFPLVSFCFGLVFCFVRHCSPSLLTSLA